MLGRLPLPGHCIYSRLKHTPSLFEKEAYLPVQGLWSGEQASGLAHLWGPREGGSQGTEVCGHSLSPLSCFAPSYQYIPERPLYLVLDYLITLNSLTEGPFKMKTLIRLPTIYGVFNPSFVTWHQSFERIRLSVCFCNTTHRWLPHISPLPHTHLPVNRLPVPSSNHDNLFLECFSSYSVLPPIQPAKYQLTWFPYQPSSFLGLRQNLVELTATTFIPETQVSSTSSRHSFVHLPY